jgi:hypothetical protein
MALILANRVQETSTTTGTGTLTLDGAVLGYQTFAAGIGSGNTCYYAITSTTGAWEVGVGTVGTGTLARTTLLSSSTGSLVSFTGTLNVYVTYPSEKSVNLDASNNLTVLNTTRLGGAAGNQSLQVNNVASAVNYLQVVGAVTGGIPTISAQGTDANITFAHTSKGIFGHTFNTGGGQQFAVANGASAVDFLQATGNSGGFPNLSAQGASTNVSIVYGSKGTGGHNFTTAGSSVNQAVITHTASAVNYLNLTGASTGAAPTISAQGSDANIGLVLAGKGTGGVSVTNGSGTATRFFGGANFIDFSGNVSGAAASLVASGADANIAIRISGLGTGVVALGGTSLGGAAMQVKPTTSSVNYLQATGAVTTGAPELSAQGSDANINLKLTPKGTGALQVTGTGFSPNFTLTDAATIAWDTTTAGGQVATFTFVSSNRTMGAPTNLVNGAFYALAVIQNAGSNTLTWSSTFKWAGGVAPTLSTAAGAKDYFTFRSDGVSLFQQGISQAVA